MEVLFKYVESAGAFKTTELSQKATVRYCILLFFQALLKNFIFVPVFFIKGKSCNFLHPCKCNNCQFNTLYDHFRERKLIEAIIWISSNNYDLRKSVRAKQSFLQKWIHTFVIICDCILYEPMVIGNWVLFKVLWSLCPCIRLVGEGKQRKK